MWFIINRVKILVLSILGGIRRAMCCFRRKRISEDHDDNLTQVLVTGKDDNNYNDNNWDTQWGEQSIRREPQTIQDHIQLYREKISQTNTEPQINEQSEIVDNLFQEMTPQYVTQKRVLINNSSHKHNSKSSDTSRLSISDNVSGLNELGEWMEEGASGWDEQHIDPTDFVREQKRLKREANKSHNSGLGRKLKS